MDIKLKDYMYDDIIPVRYSPKMQIKRQGWRCEHRQTGLKHPNCFNKEYNIQEKKAALDIECGALDADFDIILSWSIKTIGKNELWFDHITKKDLSSGQYDSRIVQTIIETMWRYSRIITHYGNAGRFDIPFLRARYLWLKARNLYKGPDFPGYGYMYQSDTYSMAKRCLKISSRRQGSVANTILGEDIKTKIDKNYWMAVKYGNDKQRKEALKYILDHNHKDCEQLEGNYLALKPFIRETRTSI